MLAAGEGHVKIDRLTVAAIGAVAFVGAKLAHEGLGHGGACWLTGNEFVGFSTAWAQCDRPEADVFSARAVDAAGTAANLATAALLWPVIGRARRAVDGYAVWLFAAVNGLMGMGYLFADPLFGFGDWTDVLDTFEAPTSVRVATGLAAGLVYVALAFALLSRARPLLGCTEPRRAARRLMLEPYLLMGGGLMSAAAATNDLGPTFVLTSALATLGGTSALAWLPATVDAGTAPDVEIERSTPWIVAGCVATVLALGVVGPGVYL